MAIKQNGFPFSCNDQREIVNIIRARSICKTNRDAFTRVRIMIVKCWTINVYHHTEHRTIMVNSHEIMSMKRYMYFPDQFDLTFTNTLLTLTLFIVFVSWWSSWYYTYIMYKVNIGECTFYDEFNNNVSISYANFWRFSYKIINWIFTCYVGLLLHSLRSLVITKWYILLRWIQRYFIFFYNHYSKFVCETTNRNFTRFACSKILISIVRYDEVMYFFLWCIQKSYFIFYRIIVQCLRMNYLNVFVKFEKSKEFTTFVFLW